MDDTARRYYRRIYEWHKKNFELIYDTEDRNDPYAMCYEKLVHALPEPATVELSDIAFVSKEVLSGLMEWAYTETSEDGYEMHECARYLIDNYFDGYSGEKTKSYVEQSKLYKKHNSRDCEERIKALQAE